MDQGLTGRIGDLEAVPGDLGSETIPQHPDAVRTAADHLVIRAHRTGTPLPQILTAVTEAFTLRSHQA